MSDRERPGPIPRVRSPSREGEELQHSPDPAGHWRSNRTAIGLLLCVWFAATFLVAWFAPALDRDFFGWRFSYYLSAQGAPLICLGIVIFYARHMEEVDRRSHLDDPDEP